MNRYIDTEKLKAEIERRLDKHWEGLPDADLPEDDWTHNELCKLGAYKELEHLETFINSLQQEQPENICSRCVYRNKTDELCEYPYGGRRCRINENGVYECNGFEEIEQQGQPESELEEAARHVYESWMGGTMDDVRRDMVELGKALNARKED